MSYVGYTFNHEEFFNFIMDLNNNIHESLIEFMFESIIGQAQMEAKIETNDLHFIIGNDIPEGQALIEIKNIELIDSNGVIENWVHMVHKEDNLHIHIKRF